MEAEEMHMGYIPTPEIQNVEVLFLYIKDYKNLKDLQLNFSGIGYYQIEKGGETLILTYRENKKYPNSIFPIEMFADAEHGLSTKKINNVTAIIGQNGSGKSNILEYLRRILTNDLAINEEALIVLKIDGETKAFHSLVDSIELEEGIEIELVRSVGDGNFMDRLGLTEEESRNRHEEFILPHLTNSRVVFYSPMADFQSLPFNFDDPKFNDISTNYLIEYDNGWERYAKQEYDKVLSHKSQTTRRFIELIYSKIPLPDDVKSFIPDSTYVQINRLKDPREGSRNLVPDDTNFLKRFHELLDKSWRESHKLKREGNLTGHFISLYKTELSYSIINHFFYNKEEEFGGNSKIDIDKINWGLSLEEIVRYYLANQKWKPNEIYIKLYDFLLEAIDQSDEFNHNPTGNFSFRVDQNVDLIKLYSCYQEYESLFLDTKHHSGLLDFYWRGISSGEKILLDLFSRLLGTKNRGFENVGSSGHNEKIKYNNLFLLIDEGELGFHPQWQKNYLKYLLDFLRYAYCEFNVQLILTSHSPFLVSDLPRENIIFLQKEGDKSFVSDPKNLSHTFGGNIHEMLVDSFFLKDGIIGAYSQDIINDVLKEIVAESPISMGRISELKHIIEAIGEPVVRVKLLNMLSEKKIKDSL
jgi:energy-coupling factor transporter ATP-binding protein EcfA2